MPKMILDYVYDNETQRSDQVYLTQPYDGGKVLDYTWHAVMDEARRMATYLQGMGYPKGSKIAMVSKNCAHFMIAELAIWMAGYTTVALYPIISADTAAYVLAHSDSVMLFVGKLDTWDEIEAGVPKDLPKIALPLAPESDALSWYDAISDTEPLQGRPARNDSDLAMIVYTSGSTGQPKGVMHDFGTMANVVEHALDTFPVDQTDRVLSYLPMAHVMERAVIGGGSLVIGFRVYFAESLDTFVTDLKRAKPTIFISVPRLWVKFQLGVFDKVPEKKLNFLLNIPFVKTKVRKSVLSGLGLDHVRLAFSGSAPIPPDLIVWYRKLGLQLLEGYGMSEDFAYSHRSTLEYSEPGCVGIAQPGVEVRISDEGEILIKSVGRMVGYYKQEALTEASFTEDGFFKTGDRGLRLPNGLLKITGRIKELFKTSKGKYIAPAPIENILNNNVHVELSCVAGSGYSQPFAHVVIAEERRAETHNPEVKSQITTALEKLLQEVNAQVEHHERLAFLAIITEDWTPANGLLTPTLKIRRSAIEERYQPKVADWYDERKNIVWV